MIESKSQIRVRYEETDASGMVYHGSLIPWLEVARVEMMDNLGLPYKQLENKEGSHMAVFEVHVKILKPAYFDDRLLVKAYIKERPKVRLTVEYEILREGVQIATAETKHAFMNSEKKAIKPPKVFMETINGYF